VTRRRRAARVAGILLAAVWGAGCGNAQDGALVGPSAGATGPRERRPEGFATATVTVTSAGGAVCRRCMWLAERADQRAVGLMHVTDLGGATGMVFVYDTARPVAYWMRDTPMALSIAFFGDDGGFVAADDMDPCEPGEPCPHHPSGAPARVVVEVPRGGLGAIGAEPGSRIVVGGPCDPGHPGYVSEG